MSLARASYAVCVSGCWAPLWQAGWEALVGHFENIQAWQLKTLFPARLRLVAVGDAETFWGRSWVSAQLRSGLEQVPEGWWWIAFGGWRGAAVG